MSTYEKGQAIGLLQARFSKHLFQRVCLSSGKLSLSRRKIIYQHPSVGDLVATQQKRYGNDFAEKANFAAVLSSLAVS